MRNRGGRWGTGLIVNHVGDVQHDGRAGRGFRTATTLLLDINARYYIDEAKRHRVGVRLENAFDEEYGRPKRGFRDVDDSGFAALEVGDAAHAGPSTTRSVIECSARSYSCTDMSASPWDGSWRCGACRVW